MAFEVRVYDEVTDVDPKVMWGLTWRQLIAAAAMGTLSALVSWQLVALGRVQDVAMAIAVTCSPFVLWAWTRPAGLRLERWLPQVLGMLFSTRKLLYRDDEILSHRNLKRRTRVSRAIRKEAREREAGR